MPNLLLSFLVTVALLTAVVYFAWLLINAPVWLLPAMLVAGVFGLVWAFVHEAVADRRGRR